MPQHKKVAFADYFRSAQHLKPVFQWTVDIELKFVNFPETKRRGSSQSLKVLHLENNFSIIPNQSRNSSNRYLGSFTSTVKFKKQYPDEIVS